VSAVSVAAGQQVDAGTVLVVVDEPDNAQETTNAD
ncbi:MAG: hypothetical protein QOC82_1388, partial [Frankiaceae bacterium]|nr:hypothetical protein [Frankiaceae bacterium]